MPGIFVALWVSLAVLGTGRTVWADALSEGNASFSQRQYKTALPKFLEAMKQGPEAKRTEALHRAVLSHAFLNQFEGAIDLLQNFPRPKDPLPAARHALLKLQLAELYLQYFASGIPADSTAGSELAKHRTQKQWVKYEDDAFESLQGMREQLVLLPLSSEGDWIDLQNRDSEKIPTLWDYAILQYGERLKSRPETNETGEQAFALVEERFASPAETTDPILKLAGLYEEAARLGGPNRGFAREYWRLERAELASRKTVPEKDLTRFREKRLQLFSKWMNTFQTGRGRALAGYRAAEIENQTELFADAVKRCKTIEGTWAKTEGARQCYELRAQIVLPVLDLTTRLNYSPAKRIEITARNLERVYLRVYSTTREELLSQENGPDRTNYWALRSLNHETLTRFVQQSPKIAVSIPVKYKTTHAFAKVNPEDLGLERGVYVVVASSDSEFAPNQSLIEGAVFSVSGVRLFASSNEQESETPESFFRVYALDAQTGEPWIQKTLEARGTLSWSAYPFSSQATNTSGFADFKVRVAANNFYAQLDPLIMDGPSYSLLQNGASLSYSAPAKLQLGLDADRPIYRPGQTARLKLTTIVRNQDGFTVLANGTAKIVVTDPNGKNAFEQSVKLGEFGSGTVTWKVPTGRLLGSYLARATIRHLGRDYSGGIALAVEEYSRPEFEVSVNPPKNNWIFGEKAELSGTAKYYFGGPVKNARVNYRIIREPNFVYWCHWWRPRFSRSDREEVAHGTLTTNDQGAFEVSFVPQPVPEQSGLRFPARFTIEVDALDKGGRTLSASREIVASSKPYFFKPASEKNFLSVSDQTLEYWTRTLDGTGVEARGDYRLVRVSLPKKVDAENTPSWESAVLEAEGKEITKGAWKSSLKEPLRVKFAHLEAGLYRLELRGAGWGSTEIEKIPVVVAGSGKEALGPVTGIEAITKAELDKYEVGDTAKFLIGSSDLSGPLFVEIMSNGHALETRLIKAQGVTVFELPVSKAHRGGLQVRWFGISRDQIRQGAKSVEIPWSDKKLMAKIDAPAKVLPGQRVTWEVTAKDARGRAVEAEALIKVYDRSLEYYASRTTSWLNQVYPAVGAASTLVGPALSLGGTTLYADHARLIEKYVGPRVVGLDRQANPDVKFGGYRSRYSARGAEYDGAVAELAEGGALSKAEAPTMAQANSGPPKEMAKNSSPGGVGKALTPAPATAPARSDFSEVAFFDPQLRLKNGRGLVKFQMPERLTSWRVQGVVLTKDVNTGEVEAQLVTQKDLMVRVEVPRFVREGDEVRLLASVHNETGKAVEVSSEMTVTAIDGAEITGGQMKGQSRISAKGVGSLGVSTQIKDGLGKLIVRARAKGQSAEDAEEREVLVLPARERVMDSEFAWIENDQPQQFSIPASTVDSKVEFAALQVEPQLALTLLASVPQLMECPVRSTSAIVDKWVPLVVMKSLFDKFPKLAQAARKIPKRKTETAAWNENDPMRLTALLETPWVSESEGRGPASLSLMEANAVVEHAKVQTATLESLQNSDGGYPWFGGGPSDFYTTLQVLEGFGQAAQNGASFPQAAAQRAVSYVFSNCCTKYFESSPAVVSLYGAYVVLALGEASQKPEWRRQVRLWAENADKKSQSLSPYALGLASRVWRLLGDAAKADGYLDRALSLTREDKQVGVFWAPEDRAWLWYNDNLVGHTFILQTLIHDRPKDPKIDGLVKWLLFNRKGTQWKSSRAASAAVMVLVDYLKLKGALESRDKLQVKLPGQKEPQSLVVDGLEHLAPLRWEIKPPETKSQVTVSKEGNHPVAASLSWIASTRSPVKENQGELLNLERSFYRRVRQGSSFELQRLKAGDRVTVGEEIVVKLNVRAKAGFEYMWIKSPSASGFEPVALVSAWKWDGLSRYEEPRDSLMNLFIPVIPTGESEFQYTVRPSTVGELNISPAVLQSVMAPEFGDYAEAFKLTVVGG